MKEKQKRPNRIVKIDRSLFQLMGELAYFQEQEISTQDFIIEILEEIGRIYGDKMQAECTKFRSGIVTSYIRKSGVLSNPEDNNRFFEGINI